MEALPPQNGAVECIATYFKLAPNPDHLVGGRKKDGLVRAILQAQKKFFFDMNICTTKLGTDLRYVEVVVSTTTSGLSSIPIPSDSSSEEK